MATGAYSFQWKKDGVDIDGATNSSYLITSPTEEDSGAYSVLIRGVDGTCSTLSAEADVMVSSPDNPCEHFEITSDADLGTIFQNSDPNITLTAVGGVSPYTWLVAAGSLPSGLSLTNAGVITGTTSDTLGTYTFTAQATDSGDEPCQTTKEFTLELADACALENLPESIDATALRDWMIAWDGRPQLFSGPPYFTWDGILPMTSVPGEHPVIYSVLFVEGNPNYGAAIYESTDHVNLPCYFAMNINTGCLAVFAKDTIGPLGEFTVSLRSGACNGNQPPSESVTID